MSRVTLTEMGSSPVGPGLTDTLPPDMPPFPVPTFLRGVAARRAPLSSAALQRVAERLGTHPAVVLAAAVQILLTLAGGDAVLLGLVLPEAVRPPAAPPGSAPADAGGARHPPVALRASVGPESTLDSVVRQAVESVAAPAWPAQPPRILVAALDAPVLDLAAALAGSGGRDARCDAIFAARRPAAVTAAGAADPAWELACDYAEDRYSAQAADGFLERLGSILERLLSCPQTRLDELRIGIPAVSGIGPASGEDAFGSPGTGDQGRAARHALGPTELALAEIWSGVLGLDQISADDDFFALGGHSLAAARVLGRVRAVFSVELALDELFGAPTLKAAAARIDAAVRSGERAADVALAAGSGDGTVSFGQERLWFLEQWGAGGAGGAGGGLYNVPLVVRLRGGVDGGVLRR
ncbi:MAG TPA: phosphopantetheine-binding protein, partial [Streptosporangiaceae bacterium]|nr:phosphopantetheine-binding protein [Streptosporangiaceae bacterium]